MKKFERMKFFTIPVTFLAIVAFALLYPANMRRLSADDILSVAVTSKSGVRAVLDTKDEIAEFLTWLGRTVPAEETYFVRETDAYHMDEADWQMVANQVPDRMTGLDEGETFAYSIYHMYVYVTGDTLYYNGVMYDIAPDAKNAIEDLVRARD